MNQDEAIAELKRAKATVEATTAANPEQAGNKADLLRSIDQRLKVVQKEAEFKQQSAANQQQCKTLDRQIASCDEALAEHEQLKAELLHKYSVKGLSPSDLSPADRDRYLDSRVRQQEAQQTRDALAAQKNAIADKQRSLQQAYDKFRASDPINDLFPGEDIDSICVPCVQSRVASFEDKQKRLAEGNQVFPGQQHYGNCGVQSTAQIIQQATGNKPDETTLLQKALENDDAYKAPLLNRLFSSQEKIDELTGGTTAEQRQDILKSHGVDSQIQPTTKENLAQAIKDKKGIIATVDAGVFWEKSGQVDAKDAVQYVGGGHAVMVYDGDFDEKGNLTHVYINDTGTGKQVKMTVDDFLDGAEGRVDAPLHEDMGWWQRQTTAVGEPTTTSTLNVTDKSIW